MENKYDSFLEGGSNESVMNKYDTFLEGAKEKPSENFFIENAPIIGSIIGGIGGSITPIPGGAYAGSVAGTALGTSIGSSARQIARAINPQSPVQAQPTKEFLTGQAKDVAEQSALDLAGNLLIKGVSIGYKSLLGRKPAEVMEGAGKAQEMMKQQGSFLTPGQVSPRSTQGLLEGTFRTGLLSRGIIEGQYEAQDAALKAIKGEFLNPNRLDPVQRGQLILDALKGGNRALDAASGKLYGELDNIATATGASVDITPIQQAAQKIVEQQKRISNVGLTDQGGEILNKLVQGNKSLSFADAHALRSSLLARSRGLESGDLAKRNIDTFVDILNKQMEQGAKAAGGDLWDKYQNVSKFYKESINKLNDDYILSVAKRRPEEIGEALYQAGNVTGVQKMQVALRRAAALDRNINYKKVMDNVKEGFVEKLLNKLNTSGETQGTALLRDFEDRKMRQSINALLSPEMAEKLKTFAQASKMAQSRPEGVAPILTSMVQASAVVGLGGYVLGGGDPEALGLAAPVILGPRVMAKLLMRPGMADKLIMAATATPRRTPISKSYLVKFANEVIKTKEEVEKGDNEAK